MPDLEIHLLGPFEVFFEGNLVKDFKTNKASALLAYLVCETDRAHTRLALTRLFWPDLPEKEARDHLRAALRSLRQALERAAAASPAAGRRARRTAERLADMDAFAESVLDDALVVDPRRNTGLRPCHRGRPEEEEAGRA